MSDKEKARYTDVLISVNGTDVTEDLKKYLQSVTYTDEEEDKTDDISITLDDREGVWIKSWIGQRKTSAESSGSAAVGARVMVKQGAKTFYGGGLQSWVYTYEGFTVIEIGKTNPDYIVFGINGAITAACHRADLIFPDRENGTESSGSAGASNADNSEGWAIGDEVIANGRPQYSSWGAKPGWEVKNHRGKVTHLNLKPGIPYPIHVDYLGWFSEDQVQKVNNGAKDNEISATGGLQGGSLSVQIVRKNFNSDGKDSLLDCGTFQIDSIALNGPPSKVTIKGTSLPSSSTVRAVKKSKAWEQIKLSAIANQIASANKMKSYFSSDYDPLYTRKEQAAESDIVFLQRLCKDAGISLKVTNNTIILFDEAEYEKKPAVMTIKNGEGNVTSYSFSDGTSDTAYSSCHVCYTNPQTGAKIEYTYTPRIDNPSTGEVLEINEKVNNREEARKLAMKRLRQKNKERFSASFKLIGNTSLVAGVTVNVEGWGCFDGKYIVEQSAHTVSNGYTTQIKLHKVLEEY